MSYMNTVQDLFDEKKQQQQKIEQQQKQQQQQQQKQQKMHPATIPVNNFIQKWVDAKIPVSEGQCTAGQIGYFLQHSQTTSLISFLLMDVTRSLECLRILQTALNFVNLVASF